MKCRECWRYSTSGNHNVLPWGVRQVQGGFEVHFKMLPSPLTPMERVTGGVHKTVDDAAKEVAEWFALGPEFTLLRLAVALGVCGEEWRLFPLGVHVLHLQVISSFTTNCSNVKLLVKVGSADVVGESGITSSSAGSPEFECSRCGNNVTLEVGDSAYRCANHNRCSCCPMVERSAGKVWVCSHCYHTAFTQQLEFAVLVHINK